MEQIVNIGNKGRPIISEFLSKEALTVEQVLELLDSFDTKTLKGKRDYALLNLMINTGLRVMEIQSRKCRGHKLNWS